MRVTLDAPIGGLGDALLFSTLPQLYAERGDDVYISERTVCRNPEVFDLLYARNPYIKGALARSEADEVAGMPHERDFFLQARQWTNPIGLLESLHDFVPRHDRPQVYYRPQSRPEWRDRVFMDPTSISQAFSTELFERFAARTLLDGEAFVVESAHLGTRSGAAVFPDAPRYRVRDIYEYIDIIASCKAFVCTESGSQSVAAAVRRDGIYALCTTMHYNSRLYVWPNVNYTVTGALSADYLWNDSTAEQVGHP